MAADPPDKPTPAPAEPPAGGVLADLKVRILSALALGAVALGLLYAGVVPFAALILAVSLMMCWEWGHVVRGSEAGSVLVVHGVVVTGAIVLAALGYAAPALITLIAGAFVVAALRFGETARLSAVGVLYVGLPAVALIALRGNEPFGFLAVLFVILAVIATDTLAYFAGRAIGGPKLWPRVSPKKTWSGLAGGVGGAALVGAVFGMVVAGASVGRLAAIGLVLGLVAQGGDLAESALKRSFDVKDASGLLPGHGGFMDRMDGLVFASIVAMLIGLAGSIYAPARALLLGF
jgi:phosphatidate cytidylyltransferase